MTRNLDIDFARGVAITLVVFAHCLRGLVTAGIVTSTPLVHIVDAAIYLFHMPLFFLLSGVFFAKALQNQPGPFLLARLQRLIYPLVIWTWAMALAKILLASQANQPFEWAEFPLIPLPPFWQFWFLWALFLIQLATYALAYVLRQRQPGPLFWVGSVLAAILLLLLLPSQGEATPYFKGAISNAPFFLLGPLLLAMMARLKLSAVAFLAAFVAAQLLWLVTPWSDVLKLLCATVASIAVYGIGSHLCRASPEGWIVRGFVLLGSFSMAIFLTHTFFSAGIRVVLLRLDVTAPSLHIIVGSTLGLLAPLVLARFADHWRIARLMGFR